MAIPKIGNREAGAGLSKGHADKSRASLDALLDAIRDEMTSMKGTVVAAADASDLGTAITLVNELKTKMNALAAIAKAFDKK